MKSIDHKKKNNSLREIAVVTGTRSQRFYSRMLPRQVQRDVLERDRYTCYMCGAMCSDSDEYCSGKKVRLTVRHFLDKRKGGDDTASNLRAVCSNCNEGLQNAAPPKPDFIMLKTYVRRATQDDQRKILDWLCEKFNKKTVRRRE